MRLDRYTIKSQEAISEAVRLAEGSGNQVVAPEHMLLSLLKGEGTVVRPLLDRIGVKASLLIGQLEECVNKLPSVSGSDV